jgi:2-polyprenyl-3-methyl-5-hydroxy-6-metoxy-1,4-benzoquinol methylase
MNSYYSQQKQWYEKNYWGENHNDLLLPNGITGSPSELISKIKVLKKLITHDGKIIDLGCGNGLLLKMYTKQTDLNIIPYGVDFMEKSIRQAKRLVFPEHKGNFIVGNIIDYTFTQKFDYIITDPGCASAEDIGAFYKKCFSALKGNGLLIMFIQSDVCKRINQDNKILSFLKSKKLHWLKSPPILCCHISKK